MFVAIEHKLDIWTSYPTRLRASGSSLRFCLQCSFVCGSCCFVFKSCFFFFHTYIYRSCFMWVIMVFSLISNKPTRTGGKRDGIEIGTALVIEKVMEPCRIQLDRTLVEVKSMKERFLSQTHLLKSSSDFIVKKQNKQKTTNRASRGWNVATPGQPSVLFGRPDLISKFIVNANLAGRIGLQPCRDTNGI